MIGPTGAVRVLVATKPVDLRNGAEGLAALVRKTMAPIRCQGQSTSSGPSAPIGSSWCPEVDLVVSRWFFSPGDGFILSDDPELQWLRKSSPWALAGVILAIFAMILRDAINGALTWARMRKPIWLLSGLALGPGLIVNGLLKSQWGRPRPVNVDVFGGDAVHQMVWAVSDWCDRNCSFVSGEASSSAWLVAAALVTPKPVRLAATAAMLVYAIALSLNRIAFGGHFLSDVFLAWLICGLVFAILYRLIPGTAYAVRSGGNVSSSRGRGRADLPGSADPASTSHGHAARKRDASPQA